MQDAGYPSAELELRIFYSRAIGELAKRRPLGTSNALNVRLRIETSRQMNFTLGITQFGIAPLLLTLAVFSVQGFAEISETVDSGSGLRASLTRQVNRNIEAGTRALAAASKRAEYIDAKSKAEFLDALKVARSAENRLRRRLAYLQSASADDWPWARATLAEDYEAYAQGIASAERIVDASISFGPREPHPRGPS